MSTSADKSWQGKGQHPVVAILLFDGVEVLDFAGPYEVFGAARNDIGNPYCKVFTVGNAREITCHGGLRVIVDATLDTSPTCDLLVVPGGPGAREQTERQGSHLEFIQKQKNTSALIASVCTGAFLLARAGLLDGKRATTHSQRLELFAGEFPKVRVENSKIVDEGDLITAGGVASGIDLALYLLERWFGSEARRREARRLDGPW